MTGGASFAHDGILTSQTATTRVNSGANSSPNEAKAGSRSWQPDLSNGSAHVSAGVAVLRAEIRR